MHVIMIILTCFRTAFVSEACFEFYENDFANSKLRSWSNSDDNSIGGGSGMMIQRLIMMRCFLR